MSGDENPESSELIAGSVSLAGTAPPWPGSVSDMVVPRAAYIPSSRSQLAYGADGGIEILVLTDDNLRRLKISMIGVPFSVFALGEPRVRRALENWVCSSPDETSIGWNGLRAALVAEVIDIGQLAGDYPLLPRQEDGEPEPSRPCESQNLSGR